MKLRVILADQSGFCEGVARAVEEVRKRAGSGERLVTLGPLVHNPQVVKELEGLGVRVLREPSEWKGETVVIRTHGVPPSTREDLRRMGANILDLTCPRVARVQRLVEKAASEGRPVVIAGDPGHAESVGLKGFSGDRGIVVPSPDELELPPGDRVLVVAQTTQSEESFQSVVEEVSRRAKNIEVVETICPFTVKRRAGVKALLDKVDAAVIVGGRMSANTRRLYETFVSNGVRALLVETEADLEPDMLREARVVGVAAGASTPPEVVRRVIEAIERIGADYNELPASGVTIR